MNHASDDKPPSRWTEEQVERLLLKVFGDPPGHTTAGLSSRRARWSHWPQVAMCAALLLALAPMLLTNPDARHLAQRSEPREEMVVADASDSEVPETTIDEKRSEETSDVDSASDTAEASSS